MSEKGDLGHVTVTRCSEGERTYYIASVRVGPKGEFGSVEVVPGDFGSEEEARLAAQDLYRSRVALIGEGVPENPKTRVRVFPMMLVVPKNLKGGEQQHAQEHRDWIAPNGACARCARDVAEVEKKRLRAAELTCAQWSQRAEEWAALYDELVLAAKKAEAALQLQPRDKQSFSHECAMLRTNAKRGLRVAIRKVEEKR